MWGRSERGFAADPALAAEGLIFVMTRMQVQMDAYPRWGDVVAAETWFQAAGKIGAQRDWVLRDKASGRVLGRATSTWVMINMHTRRLAKMPDSVRRRLNWFQLAPPEFAIPPEATRAKLPDLDPPPAAPGAPPLLPAPRQVARRSDMDMNGHINNVTYVAWALESIPAEVASGAHLYQVEIDYKAECHAGDVVEGVAQRAPAPGAAAANGAGADALAFVHALRRCEAGGACATELVRARTTWRLGGPVA
jgi:fatty acyl-ACP thioesterase A